MKEVVDIIQAARGIIADPTHWTQGTQAREMNGAATSAMSENATSYCAVGALLAAAHRLESPHSAYEAVMILAHRVLGGSVSAFNDKSPHAEVLAMFDRLIGEARKEES